MLRRVSLKGCGRKAGEIRGLISEEPGGDIKKREVECGKAHFSQKGEQGKVVRTDVTGGQEDLQAYSTSGKLRGLFAGLRNGRVQGETK